MISDFRNKTTQALFLRIWLVIMRAGYLVPLICSMFFIWKLQKLSIYEAVGLGLLCLGTIIVFAAKIELGELHSWAGYATLKAERFCKTGIYSWIRHPLYLGIMIVNIGIAFIVIPNFHFSLQISLTFLIGSFLTFLFLIVSSSKETKYLSEKFGNPFRRYATQVYSFIPLRKFNDTTDTEP